MSIASNRRQFRHFKLAQEAKQALSKLQAFRYKAASIGGDRESQFEQAFASLAYAYMKDKAPRLLDFMVGFQLVDRNDDNTKAIGVFGFKVGEQWVYAPVFFLNGDLKGHELLYIKAQDQFVPLKEDWVNYLLNRKPHVLGEGTPYTLQQLGVMRPQLAALSTSPISKRGSDDFAVPEKLAGWCREFLPLLGAAEMTPTKLLEKFAGFDERWNMREFLAQDLRFVTMAMQAAKDYPSIKQAFDRFYGPDLFRDALLRLRSTAMKQASLLADEPPRPTTPESSATRSPRDLLREKLAVAVKIDDSHPITYNVPDMTPEERSRLYNDGVLIRDKRNPSETSRAYNTQIEMRLINPTETGIYELLTAEGTFERCLVISGPASGTGSLNFCTVVRLDGDKNWLNAYRSQLWVRDVASREDFRKWQKDGQNSDSKKLENGALYVAISPGGQGTVPFEVNQKIDDGCYDVWYREHAAGTPPINVASRYNLRGMLSGGGDIGGVDDGRSRLYINKNEGSKLKSMRNALYLPSDSRIIKVKDAPDWRKIEPVADSEKRKPEPLPIVPGNLADLTLQILQKTARLKIYSNRTDYTINTNRPRTKTSALIELVRNHGFSEKSARLMLSEADRKQAVVYRVKYADPYLTSQGEYSPPFPEPDHGFEAFPNGNGASTIDTQNEHMTVPGLESGNTDPMRYNPWARTSPDQATMQAAQQAGQQGQKEVFDTAMIGGMLKSVREDSLVDRYLGDMLKALDRLGRVLFMFYWHNEAFSDRYGKQDMPELEDSLRNTFESLGDITLFLKQKTVDPYSQSLGEPSVEQAARG